MLLKRLAGSLSPDLAVILPDLDVAGIRTSETLIFTPLAILRDLVPTHRDKLEDLQEECLYLTCPPEKSGEEVLDELEMSSETQGSWAGFGCSSLDELFGEWHGRGILEIAGPSRVGKSVRRGCFRLVETGSMCRSSWFYMRSCADCYVITPRLVVGWMPMAASIPFEPRRSLAAWGSR